MAIRLVSWNVEGRLTRFTTKGRGSPESICEHIDKLDGDIVFLAEASDGDVIDPSINQRIEAMGYEVYTASYDDIGKDRQWSAEKAPNMKLLSRLPLRDCRHVRLGGIRNAIVARVADPDTGGALRVIGVHLDDRNEPYRLRQVEDLLVLLSETSEPTIVTGDYNAMHAMGFRARFLRSRWLAWAIKRWPHARTQDMLARLADMAIGDALTRLQDGSDLTDVDTRRRATSTPKLRYQEWMPSVRMVQIDHMFVTPSVTVRGFRVGKDGGSDHRPISAIVSTKVPIDAIVKK